MDRQASLRYTRFQEHGNPGSTFVECGECVKRPTFWRCGISAIRFRPNRLVLISVLAHELIRRARFVGLDRSIDKDGNAADGFSSAVQLVSSDDHKNPALRPLILTLSVYSPLHRVSGHPGMPCLLQSTSGRAIR